MKLKARGLRRILPRLAFAGLVASPGALLAQSAPAYQDAITEGLGTANTAGVAILTAGAVIVVTMLVWAVIKKFARAAK